MKEALNWPWKTFAADPIQSAAPGKNRRRESRFKVRGEPAVTLSHGGRTFKANLTDISSKGAGVRIPSIGKDLELDPGDRMDIRFDDSGGQAGYPVLLVWMEIHEGVVRMGARCAPEDSDAAARFEQLDMDQVRIDPAWATRLPPNLAVRRQVLPFALYEGKVHIACTNPQDAAVMKAVERHLRRPIHAERAEPESLRRALTRVYGDAHLNENNKAFASGRRGLQDFGTLTEDLDADSAVDICNELLHAAVLRRASDIHIDPERDDVALRFRIDGVLEKYGRLPVEVHAGVLSRFKVLSAMDIAEKRAPQDGGFTHRYGGASQNIDIRTATLPTKYGERMTLRLLALQTETLTLERLGMNDEHLTLFEECIGKPHGLIIITGPTGSGKTTTLYAALRRIIKSRELNVITVEDPIEYNIPGVAQVEVDSADKVSFHRALRSLLRHDPDVVMIGEIRDRETADVAIKAALTGHLVFSTLHTNSAAGAITRLADMGVERYLIGATLRLVVAQRLVRSLCQRCSGARTLTQAEAGLLHLDSTENLQVHDGKGCLYCGDTGYVGRTGLYEMIPVDEQWARRIAQGSEKAELMEMMRAQNLKTLVEDAGGKALTGITSVSEVLNAVSAW